MKGSRNYGIRGRLEGGRGVLINNALRRPPRGERGRPPLLSPAVRSVWPAGTRSIGVCSEEPRTGRVLEKRPPCLQPGAPFGVDLSSSLFFFYISFVLLLAVRGLGREENPGFRKDTRLW